MSLFNFTSNTLVGVVVSGYYDFDSGQVRITLAQGQDQYVFLLVSEISDAFWQEYRAGMTVRITYQPGNPDTITAYDILS